MARGIPIRLRITQDGVPISYVVYDPEPEVNALQPSHGDTSGERINFPSTASSSSPSVNLSTSLPSRRTVSVPNTPVIIPENHNNLKLKEPNPPFLRVSRSTTSLGTVRAVRRVRRPRTVSLEFEDPDEATASHGAAGNTGPKFTNDRPTFLKTLRRRISSVFGAKEEGKAIPTTLATSGNTRPGREGPKSPTTSQPIEHIAPPSSIRRAKSFVTPGAAPAPSIPKGTLENFEDVTREASFIAKAYSRTYRYSIEDEESEENVQP
ncbi:hypothetical protein CVT26_007186 [Gymnopilus dilepis]|uniref:Uncharacterized protein n=1 Tax=Gymnopilus dilepis TaxID=231916 RepID=A0A409W080_9AGAR|nr:hypothetical protein CVT26_007186 [Gymnopilus dilepis]